MVKIEFCKNGKTIKGILLGRHQSPHDEVYSVEKKILWETKQISKHRTLNTPLYIVFVPWKHKEKELLEVDEKYVVNPQDIKFDETWIKKDNFISEKAQSHNLFSYSEKRKVNDFVGYKFIYDNNSFMINIALNDNQETLSVLYKELPEILEVDLNNNEE